MKHFPTFAIVLVLTMIVSACGSPAAPTMNAADVQNTAVAAAFTMVAQTQAAMPTNTPLPPTEAPTQTPLPTDTPVPLPTLATSPIAPTIAAPTTSSGGGGGDPCNQALNHSPLGKETTIRILNTTKVPVTVSLYLNPTEGHGECGYRSYNLAKGADVVIKDLVYGCYNLWAWSDAPKGKFNSSGSGCINNPDKWTFEINTATVKFVGP